MNFLETTTNSISREIFTHAEAMQMSLELQVKENGIRDIIKQINYQIELMSKHYDKSIDEQSEVMQDFYNFLTNRFETHSYYQG